MRHGLKALAITVLLGVGVVGTGHGATITVDFDDVAPTSNTFANFISNGFRFSSRSYYRIERNQPGDPLQEGFGGTQHFGFGRFGTVCNPEYIGPEYGFPDCDGSIADSEMFIDNFGKPFSLESLYGVLNNNPLLRVTSSKGGTAFLGSAVSGPMIHTFAGADWNGVKWLRFESGFGTTGFDHITFKAGLPEPGTLALLALGLLGLGLTARRRQH